MSVTLGFSEARRKAFTAACFGSTEKISDSTVWSLNSVTTMRRPRAWRSLSMSAPISLRMRRPKIVLRWLREKCDGVSSVIVSERSSKASSRSWPRTGRVSERNYVRMLSASSPNDPTVGVFNHSTRWSATFWK
jgi:hypothetical protein